MEFYWRWGANIIGCADLTLAVGSLIVFSWFMGDMIRASLVTVKKPAKDVEKKPSKEKMQVEVELAEHKLHDWIWAFWFITLSVVHILFSITLICATEPGTDVSKTLTTLQAWQAFTLFQMLFSLVFLGSANVLFGLVLTVLLRVLPVFFVQRFVEELLVFTIKSNCTIT